MERSRRGVRKRERRKSCLVEAWNLREVCLRSIYSGGREGRLTYVRDPHAMGKGGWLFTVGNRKPKQFRFRSKFGYSFHLFGLKPESPYAAQSRGDFVFIWSGPHKGPQTLFLYHCLSKYTHNYAHKGLHKTHHKMVCFVQPLKSSS